MTVRVDLSPLEAASRKGDKARELMLLDAAVHIKMARVQRALYQAKVELAVQDATAKKDHLWRVYMLIPKWAQTLFGEGESPNGIFLGFCKRITIWKQRSPHGKHSHMGIFSSIPKWA
jgi:hypothetical protein